MRLLPVPKLRRINPCESRLLARCINCTVIRSSSAALRRQKLRFGGEEMREFGNERAGSPWLNRKRSAAIGFALRLGRKSARCGESAASDANDTTDDDVADCTNPAPEPCAPGQEGFARGRKYLGIAPGRCRRHVRRARIGPLAGISQFAVRSISAPLFRAAEPGEPATSLSARTGKRGPAYCARIWFHH